MGVVGGSVVGESVIGGSVVDGFVVGEFVAGGSIAGRSVEKYLHTNPDSHIYNKPLPGPSPGSYIRVLYVRGVCSYV